jgi:hypothetical protein
MISSDIVTETWQRMSQVPPEQAPEMVNQMRAEQPVALGFLLHLEDFPFNRYEQELIFYIGMVVWQIMKQSRRQLYKVTRKKLQEAEERSLELLDDLATSDEGDLVQSIQRILRTYPEPAVLRYIVEAIMEADPEEPGFRDEYTGLAFVHLKILLDAFINSLASRPRLVT